MILVRHAHAGNKAQWQGDDTRRPLSAKGRAQAEWLVRALVEDPMTQIWSSPALRCLQTVEPLALERGVSVHEQALLAKDAKLGELLAWLLAHRSEPWVMCTHGETFRGLFGVARSAGLIAAPAIVTQKGAAWRARPDVDGQIELEYIPPLFPT